MDTDALQRLDSFLSDPQVPQEDKNRAVAMARTQEQSAEPSPIVPSEARQRSGSYLANKANQFVGALQGVGKDVENVVTGQPYGTGFPGERGALDTIGDVATTAAPVVAPELTGLGLGVGTLARGAGYSEPTADVLNTGSQLAVGGGQAVKGLVQGASAAKAALQARYTGLGEAAAETGARLSPYTDAAQVMKGKLEKALGRFPLGSAERQTAKSLIRQLTPADLPPGVAGTNEALLSGGPTYADMDEALGNVQGLKRTSPIRGAIKEGMTAVLQGTPEEGMRAAIDKPWQRLAGKPVMRGTLGGLSRLGTAGGAIGAAYHGNYKLAGGLAAGALLGGQSPGQLLAAGRAAAGPLARTAAAVGGQASGLDLGGGGGGDETQPADIGTAGLPATETPPPSPASPSARIQPLAGPYGREIAAVASLVKIPPELIQVQMHHESSDRPGAVSHPAPDQAQTPAYGLMQITPGTFKSVAKEAGSLLGRVPSLDNPFDNILAGGLLMKRYLDRTNGDVGAALKMYHGGENPAYWGPRTEQYSRDIDRKYAAAAARAGAGPAPAPKGSGWQQNLDQRVAAGYITPEQAAAEGGG